MLGDKSIINILDNQFKNFLESIDNYGLSHKLKWKFIKDFKTL